MKGCPKEHSRYDEMLEIQKQQLKLLEESFHRKTAVLASLFNKVAGLQLYKKMDSDNGVFL